MVGMMVVVVVVYVVSMVIAMMQYSDRNTNFVSLRGPGVDEEILVPTNMYNFFHLVGRQQSSSKTNMHQIGAITFKCSLQN